MHQSCSSNASVLLRRNKFLLHIVRRRGEDRPACRILEFYAQHNRHTGQKVFCASHYKTSDESFTLLHGETSFWWQKGAGWHHACMPTSFGCGTTFAGRGWRTIFFLLVFVVFMLFRITDGSEEKSQDPKKAFVQPIWELRPTWTLRSDDIRCEQDFLVLQLGMIH